MNIDNSKMYLTSSAIAGTTNTDQIRVINPETGAQLKSITAAAGIIGFMQSPDFQYAYISTPGGSFSSTGYDILNMFTDEITHVNFDEVIPIITVPSSNVITANVSVGVVLGVKTASTTVGNLAETGAIAIPTTLLLGLILGSFSYTYYDYRRHKRPLMDVDNSIRYSYTYLHHLRTVSVPTVKYRISTRLPDKAPEIIKSD